MTTFEIDNKSHAVQDGDECRLHGPCLVTSRNQSNLFVPDGSWATIVFSYLEMAPGECTRITTDAPYRGLPPGTTTFFRPWEPPLEVLERERELETTR